MTGKAWILGIVLGLGSGGGLFPTPEAFARGSAKPADPVLIEFPRSFKWCMATAGHAIEGGNFDSDWWQWEQDNWGVSSGGAVDHWHRVDDDGALLEEMHANT